MFNAVGARIFVVSVISLSLLGCIVHGMEEFDEYGNQVYVVKDGQGKTVKKYAVKTSKKVFDDSKIRLSSSVSEYSVPSLSKDQMVAIEEESFKEDEEKELKRFKKEKEDDLEQKNKTLREMKQKVINYSNNIIDTLQQDDLSLNDLLDNFDTRKVSEIYRFYQKTKDEREVIDRIGRLKQLLAQIYANSSFSKSVKRAESFLFGSQMREEVIEYVAKHKIEEEIRLKKEKCVTDLMLSPTTTVSLVFACNTGLILYDSGFNLQNIKDNIVFLLLSSGASLSLGLISGLGVMNCYNSVRSLRRKQAEIFNLLATKKFLLLQPSEKRSAPDQR